MALRLSEGLGIRGHRLEQTDVCWLVTQACIQLACSLVVPENMECDAVQAQTRYLCLQCLKGALGVAFSAVFRLDFNVEYVGD